MKDSFFSQASRDIEAYKLQKEALISAADKLRKLGLPNFWVVIKTEGVAFRLSGYDPFFLRYDEPYTVMRSTALRQLLDFALAACQLQTTELCTWANLLQSKTNSQEDNASL